MRRLVFILFTMMSVFRARSQDMVSERFSAGDFPIFTASTTAAIYVDPKDFWLVVHAAHLLQEDIQRISSRTPAIITEFPTGGHIDNLIIVGSIDSSAVIRKLIKQGMISPAISGKWEAFVLKTIKHPLAGISNALVIAGSDRRGTAFGVFELSRRMGVSPWYWWADVPVGQKTSLYFHGGRYLSESPAVKYRGFFINDEAPALSGWVHEKYGGFNHLFYEKVFELLLRLKANYLWPAMWGSAFNADDPLNPALASQYGIVMGTSHHEPMLRAQQEWKRFGAGPWNYQSNAPVLDSFWKKGIENMDHHESIVTVGMRGDGDMPMEEHSNINLLEKIVADQRAIIAGVTGKIPSGTPQSWALYKEVQDYYDKGMRVPDDVTLLLCDDNWGNVRKLPRPKDPLRGGGYGMYYHFDYVGGPRNYKWLNTNSIPRVWEEMNLTKSYGDDRIWIVNVGDIKPMELPITFFLDYAWAPQQWPASRLPAYTRRWASEVFGPALADSIAYILDTYTKYNSRRKPELLSPDTYSVFNYREATTIVDDYNRLAAEAMSIGRRLPSRYHDAWFELVLYPVLACANLNELYVTAARNRLVATQGRSSANDLARRVRALFDRDSLLSVEYNRGTAEGKWDHMMDQTHIGYTGWQEPRYNNMPAVSAIDLDSVKGPSWGVTIEGSASWWPGDSAGTGAKLTVGRGEDRFIEIFNRRNNPFSFSIRAGANWIRIGGDSGTVNLSDTLRISVDLTRAPAGHLQAPLTITGPDGIRVVVTVATDNPADGPPPGFKGFVESDGCVAMEAEHYGSAYGHAGIQWQIIPGLGRSSSGVQATPVTAAAQSPGGDNPRLEYPVYLSDTGALSVEAYFSPILAFNRQPIRYAVSFDGEPPQVVDLSTGNETPGSWDKMVGDNIRISTSQHHISHPGIHVLKYWLVDPGPVLQRIVIDCGGVQPSYLGPPESPTGKGLKDYYHDYFPIGVAVSAATIAGPDTTLIIRQFNSITPENAMKMGPVHPQENRYNWKDADAIVDFAMSRGMRIRGHNLCWHEQTPSWLFVNAAGDTVSKEVLLKRLKDHIYNVVGRYKGRVYAWDVVNEAVADEDSNDSTRILRNSPWYRICGEEFIEKAFEYAHAADPQAQLFYNDYNTERPEKRERVYSLLRRLVAAGVPISGVGIQAHWSVFEPSMAELRATIDRFASLGLKVQVTELDISIYHWEKNLRARQPGESDAYTPELQRRQAEQYRNAFAAFRDNKGAITGVTFWNVSDRHTWLDNYPVPGRKNYPLLFDTSGQPKKAWRDVVDF